MSDQTWPDGHDCEIGEFTNDPHSPCAIEAPKPPMTGAEIAARLRGIKRFRPGYPPLSADEIVSELDALIDELDPPRVWTWRQYDNTFGRFRNLYGPGGTRVMIDHPTNGNCTPDELTAVIATLGAVEVTE